MRHFDLDSNLTRDSIEVKPYDVYEINKVFEHYERLKVIYAKTTYNTRSAIHQLTSGLGHEVWKWTKGL